MAKKIENKPIINQWDLLPESEKQDYLKLKEEMKKRKIEQKIVQELKPESIWSMLQDLSKKDKTELEELETILQKSLCKVSREIGKREGALVDL